MDGVSRATVPSGWFFGTQSAFPRLQSFVSDDNTAKSGYSLAGGGDFDGGASAVTLASFETSSDVLLPVTNGFFGAVLQEHDDFFGPGVDRVTVTIPSTFFADIFGTESSDRIFSRLSLRIP